MFEGKGPRAAGAQWLCGAALALGSIGTALAASLTPSVLPNIQNATFEVVAAKPAPDPLQYEKPLPLELLPFQERNDKYYSVGTAFSIGEGRYVTAAHVLLVGVNSLWGLPALRDGQGRVHAIDKIRKFSLEKDFVEFTLADQPGTAALELDTAPSPGQTVFSVGNAYGTGVVIRDGLYTSNTPEQQDGRWNWMRFSAPASPGNSGGPLVTESGKVIGVVLAKSPNENLNYALPIGMVREAPETASFDHRITYQFEAFDSTLTNTLKTSFALPVSLPEFFRQYERVIDQYVDGQLHALLAKEPERTFPKGPGSIEVLNSIPTMDDAPRIIARDDTGKWGATQNNSETYKLSSNGYVTAGSFHQTTLLHLRRPDDVSADRLYGDPKLAMDLLLRTGLFKRPIGGEKVQVTSLGAPSSRTVHRDAWGRPWSVWVWPLPYANAKFVLTALAVPDGYVALGRYASAVEEHDQTINLLALTDFAYVNYDGTFAQWRDFLRHPDLLPAAMRDTHLQIDYGKRFQYDARRLHVAYGSDLQAIQPDSMLTLGFAFYRDGDKIAWDVAELWASAKGTDDNYVMVVRNHEAPAELDDDARDNWDRVLHRRHPFDGLARNDDDVSKATGVVGPAAESAPKLLYTATVALEGAHGQDEMNTRLGLLLKGTRVDEK